MASSDLTLSFGADISGLQDGVAAAQDALAGLQPTLQGLSVPVQAFGASVAQAFANTAPEQSWAASVVQAGQQAAAGATQAIGLIQVALTSRLDPIGQGFSRLFDGVISGSETVGQAFLKLGEQMLSRFLGWCVQMAERWAVKELTQTTATTAGDATRTASTLSANAAGMAASGATGLSDIANSGARAAAGAYAAIASVPIVGPVLAPAAAATALAAVLALGAQVVSAEGGWGSVPYDGALAALHKDEMVLPSAIASPLRSMVGSLGAASAGGASANGGAGTSGDTHHHWNIQALDARSFVRLARDNPDAITSGLTTAMQRLGVSPAGLPGAGGRR